MTRDHERLESWLLCVTQVKECAAAQTAPILNLNFCGARSVGQFARLLSMFRQAESEQANQQRETSSRQREMMQWISCPLHRVKRVSPERESHQTTAVSMHSLLDEAISSQVTPGVGSS